MQISAGILLMDAMTPLRNYLGGNKLICVCVEVVCAFRLCSVIAAVCSVRVGMQFHYFWVVVVVLTQKM